MLRFLLRAVLGLAILVVVLAVAALSYRAWRQSENTAALAIAAPNGIDEASFVRLNGVDQWVTIRGEDRRNPVLLILAGGPGNTLVPLNGVFRAWEKYFTVVQWDQRGAGRTFVQNGEKGEGAMTIAQFTADGVKLSEFLRFHLHKDKIVILGHSWGSVLGVGMAKARPEYFSAYVGTGQVVTAEGQEELDYATLLKKVRAAHDADSFKALKRIGAPPYRANLDILVERRISRAYDMPAERNLQSTMTPVVLFAPRVTLLDIYDMLEHGDFAAKAMIPQILAYDARRLGPDFALPVFIFEGDKDAVTPASLSRAWFATLHAPKKEFVILKGGGHSAMLTMPDAFLKELVARVRPIAN